MGCHPYKGIVPGYKWLGKHPNFWRVSWHASRFPLIKRALEVHGRLTCQGKIEGVMTGYAPDVIVSVHPCTNNVPELSRREIERKLGRKLPFVTVVTDLGGAHSMWFYKDVDAIYIPSDQLAAVAKRNRIPPHKVRQIGLPIHPKFAKMANAAEPTAEARAAARTKVGLDPELRTILFVGGGDGFGKLYEMVKATFKRLSADGVKCQMVVICGRNERLREKCASKDWAAVAAKATRGGGGGDAGITVVPLGFVKNMDEYMAASDCICTKAGPGTIAEAAALGLPTLLFGFLPGQEAGNVRFVVDNKFGALCRRPQRVASILSEWLGSPELLSTLSANARDTARPAAVFDIARDIGVHHLGLTPLDGIAPALPWDGE